MTHFCPKSYAGYLIGYIKDDSAVAIHVNVKFDTDTWTADRVAALRAKVDKPTQRFRVLDSERDTGRSERRDKARRGSDKLRDAILKSLANRNRDNRGFR